MKNTRRLLLCQFAGIIGGGLLLVLLFETGICESGVLAGSSNKAEFMFLTVMELLTIALIPTALRLFKMKSVEADLQCRHDEALQKWGVLRLSMIELPLLTNTLFYYLFLNTSFGYMAVILLLCLAFVYPSQGRCEEEAFLKTVEE